MTRLEFQMNISGKTIPSSKHRVTGASLFAALLVDLCLALFMMLVRQLAAISKKVVNFV